MTDTEIIIEVAKLDGWHVAQDNMTLVKQFTDRTRIVEHALVEHNLGYYLTSRDAIIPVIEKVCNTSILQYSFISAIYGEHDTFELPLTDMLDDHREITFVLLTSTPKQLAIGLLKAANNWKDEE